MGLHGCVVFKLESGVVCNRRWEDHTAALCSVPGAASRERQSGWRSRVEAVLCEGELKSSTEHGEHDYEAE